MVVIVAPALAAGGIHVPHGEGDLRVCLFVVDSEEHILAVVVGREDGFHQDVIVNDDGQVEIFREVLAEVIVGSCADEVDGVIDPLIYVHYLN